MLTCQYRVRSRENGSSRSVSLPKTDFWFSHLTRCFALLKQKLLFFFFKSHFSFQPIFFVWNLNHLWSGLFSLAFSRFSPVWFLTKRSVKKVLKKKHTHTIFVWNIFWTFCIYSNQLIVSSWGRWIAQWNSWIWAFSNSLNILKICLICVCLFVYLFLILWEMRKIVPFFSQALIHWSSSTASSSKEIYLIEQSVLDNTHYIYETITLLSRMSCDVLLCSLFQLFYLRFRL